MIEDLLRRLNLDIPTLVVRLAAVFRSSVVSGVVTELVVLSGETQGTAVHTLGRAHIGATPIRSTAPVVMAVAAAVDTRTVIVTLDTAPVSNVTIQLWVF